RYIENNPVNLVDPEGLQHRRRADPIETRYIPLESLPAQSQAWARENPTQQILVGFIGGRSESFTEFHSRQALEAALRPHPGAYIGIYDPRYQRFFEEARGRVRNSTAAEEVAEELARARIMSEEMVR